MSEIKKAIKIDIQSIKKGIDNENAHIIHPAIHHIASDRLPNEAMSHDVLLNDSSFCVCCSVSYSNAVSLPETKHDHTAIRNSANANHQNHLPIEKTKYHIEAIINHNDIDNFLLYLSDTKPVGISNNTIVIAKIDWIINKSASHNQ